MSFLERTGSVTEFGSRTCDLSLQLEANAARRSPITVNVTDVLFEQRYVDQRGCLPQRRQLRDLNFLLTVMLSCT